METPTLSPTCYRVEQISRISEKLFFGGGRQEYFQRSLSSPSLFLQDATKLYIWHSNSDNSMLCFLTFHVSIEPCIFIISIFSRGFNNMVKALMKESKRIPLPLSYFHLQRERKKKRILSRTSVAISMSSEKTLGGGRLLLVSHRICDMAKYPH